MQATPSHIRTMLIPNPKSAANVLACSHRILARSRKKPGYAALGLRTRMALLNSQVCCCLFIPCLLPLRSFQEVIQILTMLHTAIFPGYYTGRATHIHTKVFPEWTPHPNGTFTGTRLVHVGQFFFDDEINLVVDKVCMLSSASCPMRCLGDEKMRGDG